VQVSVSVSVSVRECVRGVGWSGKCGLWMGWDACRDGRD
jgi:hypothetical protein